MTTVTAERAKDGYLLGKDEGEAHWLLGMLEIVKISGADTGGEYGLLPRPSPGPASGPSGHGHTSRRPERQGSDPGLSGHVTPVRSAVS